MSVLTYSPSHVDPALLERLTIGASRHHLLGTLVEAVRSEVGRAVHQHHLLIGPRGSGKTHVLTLTAHRLRSDTELGGRTLPFALAEEVVASQPADLMRTVLEKLSETLEGMDAPGVPAARRGTGAALAALRSEADDDRALEIAMGALEEASASLGRLLVPIVENLHLLLYSGPGLSRRTEAPGQWALRRALLESRGVLLLAASPTVFGEVCDPRAPFYDFFRIHRLEELRPEEMLELIRTRLAVELEGDSLDPTHRARLQALADHFDERAPKLRGLLTLTGGLPRFAHLLFDLLAETEVHRIVDLLARFLDKQTPYFQPYLDPRMNPEAELGVLDRLASAEGPLTPRELATGLRAGSVNAVSTYLKRLREKGLIRQTGKTRRDARYDLTEPLFRVWRRFRLGRTEREQVVILAEFVAAMFEPAQLQAEWSHLEGIETAGFRRRVIEVALERQGEWDPELWAIIEEANREILVGSLPRAYELLSQVVSRLREQGDRRKLAWALTEFAEAAFFVDRTEEALILAKEGEQLAGELNYDFGQASAIRIRGTVLIQLGNNQAALQAFKDAENLFQKIGRDAGRANAIRGRGDALLRLGDIRGAHQAFRDAETLYQKVGDDVGQASATAGRGLILRRLGDHQGSLEALKDAEVQFQKIGNDFGLSACHGERGRLEFSQGHFTQGIDHLITAYRLSRKVGQRKNTYLALSDLWTGLLQAGTRIEPDRFDQLLRRVEPLVQETGDDESVRSSLVQFTVGVLLLLGSERFLSMLPVLETGLPTSQATLLRPARVAAEIEAGQRSEELPEETDEMRRAVREVQERIRDLRHQAEEAIKPKRKQAKSAARYQKKK